MNDSDALQTQPQAQKVQQTMSLVCDNSVFRTLSGYRVFKAAGTKNCLSQWCNLTSDRHILQSVAGTLLEFDASPVQTNRPRPLPFANWEVDIVDTIVNSFMELGVIEKTVNTNDDFVSNVFIRIKKNGSHRLILNLIKLNVFIEYHHFKMDTIETVINLMRPNCFMCSIDLANAYYSIPVAKDHRRFLKFEWNNQMYQFTVLPNGLSSAPRIFSKVLKPVYAHLRQLGHVACGYIDDSIFMAQTFDSCQNNIQYAERLFSSLGFCINYDKSEFRPVQEIEHLGFLLNSVHMTVTLTELKRAKLSNKCSLVLKDNGRTIRSVAELIGLIVSSFTGAEYGRLHFRHLEADKVQALKVAAGNFDAPCYLSYEAKSEITWWIDNVGSISRSINHGNCSFTLSTDASENGWGAVLDLINLENSDKSTGGRWTADEKLDHINVLELKAGLFGLRSFSDVLANSHVKLHMDNTTAVAYINHMGGSHSMKCNEVAQNIWDFCQTHSIWLTAAHLPGHLNVLADEKSRVFNDKTEWKLNPLIYLDIIRAFMIPNIDLFASRLNFQCKPYVAWLPDPDALFIDAFTLDWSKFNFYAFPPFSMITRVLRKIEYDGARGILIVPNWPTQVWFPLLHRLLVAEPQMLKWREDLISLPFKEGPHPLGRKLQLMACFLSATR